MQLALYEPDIAQNTGTILRLCACLGVAAHIIEPAGFPISDRAFRRAGMDYLDQVTLTHHGSWAAFETWRRVADLKLVLFTTRAATSYLDHSFGRDDVLLFGRESAGVPDTVHAAARHVAGTQDEVGPVVGDGREKARQVFWGVGQVGVHERQRVKRRPALGQHLGDAGPQRGGHPPIARVATDAQEWKARRELRQPKVGGVATAVVDRPGDQIEVKRGLVAYGFQTLEERRHVVCLVVHGQHDG